MIFNTLCCGIYIIMLYLCNYSLTHTDMNNEKTEWSLELCKEAIAQRKKMLSLKKTDAQMVRFQKLETLMRENLDAIKHQDAMTNLSLQEADALENIVNMANEIVKMQDSILTECFAPTPFLINVKRGKRTFDIKRCYAFDKPYYPLRKYYVSLDLNEIYYTEYVESEEPSERYEDNLILGQQRTDGNMKIIESEVPRVVLKIIK